MLYTHLKYTVGISASKSFKFCTNLKYVFLFWQDELIRHQRETLDLIRIELDRREHSNTLVTTRNAADVLTPRFFST